MNCFGTNTSDSVFETLESRVLLSSGAVDTTFGTKGKVTFSCNTDDGYGIMTPLKNDKILVATVINSGTGSSEDEDVQLVRLMEDGTIDKTFGTNGKTIVSFAQYDSVSTVHVLNNDKIALLIESEDCVDEEMRLVLLTENGAMDKTLNKTGVKKVDSGFERIASRPNGDILLYNDEGFPISLLNANGTTKTSFGTKGVINFKESDFLVANNETGIVYDQKEESVSDLNTCVNPKTNDVYVVGTQSTSYYKNDEFVKGFEHLVIRAYDNNGRSLKSFGTKGKVDLAIPGKYFSNLRSIQILGTGKILICSESDLLMLNANGKLDKTFNKKGYFTFTFKDVEVIEDAAETSKGFIIDVVNGRTDKTTLFCFNKNGAKVNTFGKSGMIALPPDNISESVLVQSDNKFLTIARNETSGVVTITRFLP
jgi:uncharacterized delta-60 repeat protein